MVYPTIYFDCEFSRIVFQWPRCDI